jgi:hypothetical protein
VKHIDFSEEALSSLDKVLNEMGLINKDSDCDGTIIGYNGKSINIEDGLSLFEEVDDERLNNSR